MGKALKTKKLPFFKRHFLFLGVSSICKGVSLLYQEEEDDSISRNLLVEMTRTYICSTTSPLSTAPFPGEPPITDSPSQTSYCVFS